ncbi:MAG: chromosomal replication initiator protein DnaA [Eubacteriales bacterium]
MNVVKMHWNEIIIKLKEEYSISDICMKTWILPLTVSDVIDDTVYIFVDLKGSVDIIKSKYLLPLKVCIAEVTGKEYDVIFISETEELPTQMSFSDTGKMNKIKSLVENANLNPKYTFDTFVVGGNNSFAHAASVAVSESPGDIYNPLFLYGGVGLGKTHLMHSIARHILETDSTKKVLYVTSETFTNELIDSLKSGKKGNESSMQLFREKYRNIDVLLIDDVQFIIGKESTQEEFFHTFNHLHVSGKQIIISSDRPPKDIETLEARLRTRFEWGLIADISAPEYETRMAILRKKEELDNLHIFNIPDDVMDYIAKNVKSNIRELEGSLNKLVAMSRLEKKEINIELASKALKDLISPNEKRKITIELILDIVSEHYNITTEDLCSSKRNAEIAVPRQIVMYLSRTMTESPLKTIGILLGGKDHSTINHGYNKIKESIESDEKLKNTVDIIIKKINPA